MRSSGARVSWRLEVPATAAVAAAGVAANVAARHWHAELLVGEAIWVLAVVAYALAGAMAIARWRLVGETWSALVGLAWLTCAIAILPVTAVASLVAEEEGPGPLLPVAAVVLAAQAALGRRVAAVDTTFVPGRVLVYGLAATFAVAAALVNVPAFAEETGDGVGLLVATGALLVGAVLVGFPATRSRTFLGRGAGLSFAAVALAQVALLSWPSINDGRFLAAGTIALAGGLLATRAVAPHVGAAVLDLRRYEGVAARQWRDAQETVQVRQEQAHDLRSALQSIEGAVLSLRHGASDHQRAELIGAVSEQVKVAQHILDVGRSQHAAGPYDLTDLIQRLVLVEQANGRRATCRAPEVITAHGHPAAVAELLTNLLENAARHAPGALVEVTARVLPGGEVQVMVTDAGPPLPPEVAERLFQRGWRLDEGGDGSGLGLASCDRLARAEGGSIRAAAAPGAGLRVIVTLRSAALAAPTARGVLEATAPT